MRRLLLLALVACKSTTSSGGSDAAPDGTPPRDANTRDAPELDAYARRPCDAPALFFEGLVPTRVLHVVPGAVDGDGSPATPFGSIAAAAAAATPGTFIQLAPGIHAANQFIPNLRGTPDAPIWIGGVWPTRPQILGGAEGLHLTHPAYVVIQNLEVGDQTANGINIDDGVAHAADTEWIAIVNVYAHDVSANADSACIKVSGVSGLSIYDSSGRRCTRGVELVGVHGGTVARNAFNDTFGRAVIARGGSGDLDIRQNRIYDAGTTGIELGGVTVASQFRYPLSTTLPNAEAWRLRAFNNYIIGDMGAAFSFNGCIDCLVAHNFITGTPRTLIRVVQDTQPPTGYTFAPTRSGRIINNSFNWTLGNLFTFVEQGTNIDIASFTFSHNLWMSTPTLPVTETGQVIDSGTGYSPTGPTVYCYGPEGNAAIPMSEIDGTYYGYCRADGDGPTIGPEMLRAKDCLL
jgi:hypothetical protein